MVKKNIINYIIIFVLIVITKVNSQNDIQNSQDILKEIFDTLKVQNSYANELNEALQGNNNSLVTYDQNNNVIGLNLSGKLDQTAKNILNDSICKLKDLLVLDLSNNNLKGNQQNYGQFPKCIQDLKNIETFFINGNQFRGQLPQLRSNKTANCKLFNDINSDRENHFCIFDGDIIPKSCLNFKSLGEKKDIINNINFDNTEGENFYKDNGLELCKNKYVSSKMFDIKKSNIDKDIIIYSSIFPVISLIVTIAATIYGRIKSKFNRKDNITTFTASISHLPNNFGNISNTNNRQSLTTTKFDSYIRPAPRSDNENSLVDQKRISSNPSSCGNSSINSTTPQSPTISPNEIRNSNYRVIGSHYSLNPTQAIRFKNTLSMIQNNRNSIASNNSDIDSSPATTIQNMNNISSPVNNQKENNNNIPGSAVSSSTVSKGSSTPSKALESLDMLLSSPQAMYYRERLSPSKSSRPLSPIQPPKTYPSKMNPYSPYINLNQKSPIIKNKSPILVSPSGLGGHPKIPSSPAPKFITPNKSLQNVKIPSPNLYKQNSPSMNHLAPSPKKPRVRRVVYSFIADLPDELQLTPGEEVIIHKAFDDGYAYGENATNGKVGVFPITSLHPDDQDISPEEMESSPNISDIQLSQLSMKSSNMSSPLSVNKSPNMSSPLSVNKSPYMMNSQIGLDKSPYMMNSQLNINRSPNMMSPIMNKPLSPSNFNNVKIQELSPSQILKNNINNHDISVNNNLGKTNNINNLYPINNNTSQNSNSQNSLTDEDDIDSLRRQSKIPYSAFMDQQKLKLIKKQAKQAQKNKLNSINNNNNNNNGDQDYYQEPPFSPTFISQDMILNENINNRMFGNTNIEQSQLSTDIASPISPQFRNETNIKNSDSSSALEMQRKEDRRYKQIMLWKERLNRKDIGPEERRYYLQLLQQYTN